MYDINTYNLMTQLAEEQRSLWRVRQMFKSKAVGCDDCGRFWERLERQNEENVKLLEGILKGRMG
jgi:hypothetical protein